MVIACELTPAFSKDSGEPGYEAEEEDRLNAEEARYPPGERLLQEMLADQVRRMQAKYRWSGAPFVDLIMQRAAIQRRSAIAAKGTTIVKTVRQSEEAATSAELNPAMPPAKTLMVVV